MIDYRTAYDLNMELQGQLELSYMLTAREGFEVWSDCIMLLFVIFT